MATGGANTEGGSGLPADFFDVDGVGAGLGSLAADLDVVRARLADGNGNQRVLRESAVGVINAARCLMPDIVGIGLLHEVRVGEIVKIMVAKPHLWVGQGATIVGGVVTPDLDLVGSSGLELNFEDVLVFARVDVAGRAVAVDLHIAVAGDEAGQVLTRSF